MGEELTAGVPGHQVLATLEMDMELEKGVLAEGSLAQHSRILTQENMSEIAADGRVLVHMHHLTLSSTHRNCLGDPSTNLKQ